MCGIVGIVGKSNVNQSIYDALTVLQHRGQDAAGIVTCDQGKLNLRKDNGLVRDVFHTRHMLKLTGKMGIGHVRYPTAGTSSSSEAQPFYVNSPYGISLAHNGNLTNAETLKEEVFRDDLRHINTESDSEILLNVFAHELQALGKLRIDEQDIFAAVKNVHARVRGAYAVVAMITGYGIVAMRDPNGIRPLVYGKRQTADGVEYMIASESVALDAQGFEMIRDVAPGETVYVTLDGQIHTWAPEKTVAYSPCIFEHVYFARPDSIMDGISVYKARLRMGQFLARKIEKDWQDVNIDVVIPIPDTSRTTALELANTLGLLFREGFIKNRYIGRTFIMPGQQERKKSVRQKLNAIDLEFRGKDVLLVDDSIVRGTTSKQIIQMAREAGANKVYFASAAPPVRYPNVYGIDMPSSDELIGYNRDEAQIAEAIGADRLIYQDLDDLVAAVSSNDKFSDKFSLDRFDSSVFNGDYVTGDVDEAYLAALNNRRNDSAKTTREKSRSDQVMEIHNDK